MAEYDPSNPKHIALQRRQAKAADASYQAFVQHCMGLADGRRYWHDLLVRCHVFSNPFSPDPALTAFACGELNVGQQVLADIMRFCPDEYIQMMREANARSAADDARRSRSDEDSRRSDRGPEPYIHPAFGDGKDYNPVERDAEDGDEG